MSDNNFINLTKNTILYCYHDGLKYIQRNICTKIKKVKYFTILADETTDISRIEQFSLCVTFLRKRL